MSQLLFNDFEAILLLELKIKAPYIYICSSMENIIHGSIYKHSYKQLASLLRQIYIFEDLSEN